MMKMDEHCSRPPIIAEKKKKNDKDMIISKATKIIRKLMFKNVESFNGDFSFQKQKASVSKQLVQYH